MKIKYVVVFAVLLALVWCLAIRARCDDARVEFLSGVPRTFSYGPVMEQIGQKCYFRNEKGKMIATIDWSSGQVEFKGDVKNSAKIFFNHWYRQYVRNCEEKK